MPGSGGGRVAIFVAASTLLWRAPIVFSCVAFSGTKVSAGATGIGDMRQLSSLLRPTRSRIGRRLAQVVAIAAASLAVAGA
jgi:hypothetical protein